MEAEVEVEVADADGGDPAAERMRLRRLFHDMRGPLNVVIGMTELLVNEDVHPASPQHREFLADVLSAGRHLLALVDDFSVCGAARAEDGGSE